MDPFITSGVPVHVPGAAYLNLALQPQILHIQLRAKHFYSKNSFHLCRLCPLALAISDVMKGIIYVISEKTVEIGVNLFSSIYTLSGTGYTYSNYVYDKTIADQVPDETPIRMITLTEQL